MQSATSDAEKVLSMKHSLRGLGCYKQAFKVSLV